MTILLEHSCTYNKIDVFHIAYYDKLIDIDEWRFMLCLCYLVNCLLKQLGSALT